MASITIERGLNQQSSTQTSPLIGFNYQQGIQFKFLRFALTNTYAEVVFNGYAFRAVKIASNVEIDTDRYQIDMSEIVKATKTIAPFEVTVSGLVQTITFIVNGKNSAGTTVASSATQTVYLSFAKPNLKSGLYTLYTTGSTRPIYHCGRFCQFTPNGTAYTIQAATLNGTNTVYRQVEGEEVAWINRDGAWSFWNFTKRSEMRDAKKSNEIANYALSNYELKAKTYDLDTELKLQVMLDMVAVDSEHFRQLTEIGESERVIYSGKAWRVKDYTKSSAEYRQKLKFNLTLEIEENA